MISNKNVVLFCLFLAASIGCAKIPCYPPDYYAAELSSPYTAEEVRIPTLRGYILAGTLTLPSFVKPSYPAVLLITGSGLNDRDHIGTRQKPISDYKPFRQIADALSRNGIAVLRMDDQGVGCSEGGPLENVTIQERADDSRTGIEYLRIREEIDRDRIGLLGLSEGGNIGPMIAASDPSVYALVIMAGSATNGIKIREYQNRLKIDERSDLTDVEKERELSKSMKGLRQALSRGEGSPWVRSFFYYMPLPTAKKVFCPVLILHGDKDANVPVDDAHHLANAMRIGGNTDVTVKIFTNHNHLFLEDPVGNISGYKDLLRHTNKLPNDVLNTIVEWFQKRLID